MSESLDLRKIELKQQAENQLKSLRNVDSPESAQVIIFSLQQTRKQMSDLLISVYGTEENAIHDTDLDPTFSQISEAIDPKRYRQGPRTFPGVEARKEGDNKSGYAARK